MRLINTETLRLDEFHGSAIPSYAILSHTWTASELNFQDWLYVHKQNPPRWGWVHLSEEVAKIKATEGYRKIRRACELARADWWDWIWVDTVCIDKTSSAELSEAINSMYNWYSGAAICYAFLEDVPPSTVDECRAEGSRFRTSCWFKRGWTLQELLAPPRLQFTSSSWTPICARSDVSEAIEKITGIPAKPPSGTRLQQRSGVAVSDVMSWAHERQTTREEDAAYCLMGLLGINMPLLYGEGRHAFHRLQLKTLQARNDSSFLAWVKPRGRFWSLRFLETLAVDARDFHYSRRIEESYAYNMMDPRLVQRVSSLGLELVVPLMRTACPKLSFAVLPVTQEERMLWMPLWGDSEKGFQRIAFPSVTLGVGYNRIILKRVEIVLPINTEGSFGIRPLLQPHSWIDSASPVSMVLAWPLGDDPDWKILKRYPRNFVMHEEAWLDTAILRLRFDDVIRTVAYGAVEIQYGLSWSIHIACFSRSSSRA